MKIIITENQKNIAIVKWLNSEYGDLKKVESEKHPDFIFFKKDDDVIFRYHKRTEGVYISYDIWSFFGSFFGLRNEEIRDLIKKWVEGHYKLRASTIFHWFSRRALPVEEHYKL